MVTCHVSTTSRFNSGPSLQIYPNSTPPMELIGWTLSIALVWSKYLLMHHHHLVSLLYWHTNLTQTLCTMCWMARLLPGAYTLQRRHPSCDILRSEVSQRPQHTALNLVQQGQALSRSLIQDSLWDTKVSQYVISAMCLVTTRPWLKALSSVMQD